jgi:O-succinylbenzoate synthase
MIVDQASLYHLSMTLTAPFETSFGVETKRECVLVRLSSGEHEGWGECPAGARPSYSYETAATALLILERHLLPRLHGINLENPEDLDEAFKPFRGNPMARAGIEMAVWDLWGKERERSLQSMLGGSGKSLDVGISIGIQADLAGLLAKIDAALAAGYRRVKLKIKPGWDFSPLEAVRDRWPDLDLWVDANAAYSRADLDHLQQFDGFNLGLVEQPLTEEDLVGHGKLQARMATPICLDESIRGLTDARQARELRACRIINVKSGRVGGLARALEIHSYAREVGIELWCGGLLETGVGRAANLALASLPGFGLPGDISATDRYYETDVASPRFELDEGRLPVPQGHGLGVEVDPQAVARFSVASIRTAGI